MANKPMKTINFGGEDTYYLAPDFKNIENAPFGEETTYGDTLTWDGNTEGLAVLEDMFYHVSNNYPTLSEAQQGGTGEFSASPAEGFAIMDLTSNFGVEAYQITDASDFPFAMCFSQDMEMGGMQIKKGIYLYKVEYQYTTSLTINGYNGFETKVVKQLDNKYLEPFETVGGDTLTWDGNTEGLVSASNGIFFKVSDIILTIDDVQNGCTVKMQSFDGSTGEISMTGEELALVDGVLMMPNALSVHSEGVGVDLEGMVFSETGTYLPYLPEDSYASALTINGYTGFTTTKLKEEYIPVDYIKQLIAEVTGN